MKSGRFTISTLASCFSCSIESFLNSSNIFAATHYIRLIGRLSNLRQGSTDCVTLRILFPECGVTSKWT